MKLNIKEMNPFSLLIGLHLAVIALTLIFVAGHKGAPAKDREKIVVIPIEGIISLEKGSLGRGQSIDSLVGTLNSLKEKDHVKAVVLRINSPGGSVGAVQEVHGAIKKLRAKGKVIVSSFGDISASGGYYIACAGDAIVCQPGAITGSIGVIMQLPNVQGLLRKVGVDFETVKSGAMKDAGSPFRTMTEKEREHFHLVMNDAYDQFYQAVKEGRKLEDVALKPLADGRIFSGRMAYNNKLVDELGGVDEAIELAKKLTGLQDKKPEIVYHKEQKSLERLLQMFSRSPLDGLEAIATTEPQMLYMLR